MSSSSAARTLPHSLEAERAVLGAVLLDRRALAAVRVFVSGAEFYHPGHGAMFSAACALEADGAPIDAVTVTERMRADGSLGKLRAVGGEAYFAELMSAVATTEGIAHHAKIVRDRATLRRLIEAAQRISAAGFSDRVEADELVADALGQIGDIARGARAPDALVSQIESMNSALAEIEAAREARRSGARGPAITTGFRDLDGIFAGGWRPEYYLVGARPSMGKTSLMMDCAEAAAKFGDCAVLVVSLEMRHRALSLRRLSAASGVDSYQLHSGAIDDQQAVRLAMEAVRLQQLPIWYHDSFRDLSRIVSLARAWAADPAQGRSRSRRLIVTDYIGRVEAEQERRGDSREREISTISAALKGLSTDCDATMIALSQLSRALESRPDKRPQPSDLRDSGSLEQDADAIAFIYRDEAYNRDTPEPGVAEIIVAKQRNGPVGTVRLGWDAPRTRFYDLPESYVAPEPAKRKLRGGGNRHAAAGED